MLKRSYQRSIGLLLIVAILCSSITIPQRIQAEEPSEYKYMQMESLPEGRLISYENYGGAGSSPEGIDAIMHASPMLTSDEKIMISIGLTNNQSGSVRIYEYLGNYPNTDYANSSNQGALLGILLGYPYYGNIGENNGIYYNIPIPPQTLRQNVLALLNGTPTLMQNVPWYGHTGVNYVPQMAPLFYVPAPDQPEFLHNVFGWQGQYQTPSGTILHVEEGKNYLLVFEPASNSNYSYLSFDVAEIEEPPEPLPEGQLMRLDHLQTTALFGVTLQSPGENPVKALGNTTFDTYTDIALISIAVDEDTTCNFVVKQGNTVLGTIIGVAYDAPLSLTEDDLRVRVATAMQEAVDPNGDQAPDASLILNAVPLLGHYGENYVPDPYLEPFLLNRDMPRNFVSTVLGWGGKYLTRNDMVETICEEGIYTLVATPTIGDPISVDFNVIWSAEDPPEIIPWLEWKGFSKLQYALLKEVIVNAPVDLRTGNLTWSYNDLRLEGACPLVFARHYSVEIAAADLAYPEPLGYGWQHNYNYRMEQDPNGSGDVRVYLPDGNFALFPGGTAPEGSLYTLSGDTMKHRDGTQYLFDSEGRITQLILLNGETTTFTYDSKTVIDIVYDNVTGDPIEVPRVIIYLAEVSNRSGSLCFEIDDDGRIILLRDNTNRSIHFSYDGVGDLYQVCNADGDRLFYSYDEHHRLLSIVDFNGVVYLQNEYDEENRVTLQYIAGQGTTGFSYDPQARVNFTTDPYGNQHTIWYDEDDLIYKEEDAAGIREYTHDNGKRVVRQTDRLGQETLSVYDAQSNLLSRILPDGTVSSYEYNTLNKATKITRADGSFLHYEYDNRGNLTATVDALGNRSSFEYDAQNNLIAEVNALQERTTYTYDSRGLCLTKSDALNQVSSYIYDSVGRLIQQTDAKGNNTLFSYSTGGKLLSVSDAEGEQKNYTHTPNGYVASESDFIGNITSTQYNAMNQPIAITDRLSYTTTYSYNLHGELIQSVDAQGGSISYEYDAMGRVIALSDQLGNRTVFSYDAEGRLTASIDPLGQQTQMSYDALGRMLSHRTAGGSLTQYSYDLLGRQTSIEDALEQIVGYEYDLAGNLIASVDAMNRRYEYTYDELNRLVQTKDPYNEIMSFGYNEVGYLASSSNKLGSTTYKEYDAVGNLSKQIDPLGNETLYTYDNLNRLVRVEDAAGYLVQYGYDANSRIISMVDARGNTTTFRYDAEDRLTGTTDALLGVTTFGYSPTGNLVSSTTPNGWTTIYSYDLIGNLTGTKDAEQYVTVMQYDALGRLVRMVNAEAGETLYQYNSNSDLIRITHPDGGVELFSYDLNHQLTVYTDTMGGVWRYTYDANGNPVQAFDPLNEVLLQSYDLLNRLVSQTDQDGNTVTYAYDAQDRLVSYTDVRGNTWSYSYDAADRLIGDADPLQGTNSYTVNAIGRVIAHQDANGGIIDYRFDGNGNVVSLIDAEGYEKVYVYDELNRLVEAIDARGNATTYAYDADGNLLSVTNALGDTTSYSYDKVANRIAQGNPDGGSIAYTYDGLGRVVATTDPEQGTTEYRYDAMGRLIERIDPLLGHAYFSYDHEGRLLTYTDENGNTWVYTYDLLGRLISTLDPELGLTTYTYSPGGKLLSMVDANTGSTSWRYDGNGSIVGLSDPEGYDRSFSYDANSRLVQSSDANGNVTSYDYDAVGNLIAIHHPDGGSELFGYNLNNWLVSYTDGENNTWQYLYDENGNLIEELNPRGYATQFSYDAVNRMTGKLNAEGNSVVLNYDSMGRITQVINEDGAITQYLYDLKGKVTKITDALGHSRTFVYDALDRVIAATDENGVERRFSYDAVGNLIGYSDGLGEVESYTYDGLHRILSFTDRNGNTTNYEYDALSNLTARIDALGNRTEFGYDRNNRLTSVTDREENTTQYVLDGNGNIIQEIDALGNVHKFFYDSMDRLNKIELRRIDPVNSVDELEITLFSYDKNGKLVMEKDALGNVKSYSYDGNGNLILTIAEDGSQTLCQYSPVDLVKQINYSDGKQANFLYNGTGELVQMSDWTGVTSFQYDLLNQLTKMVDPHAREVAYAYDPAHNQTMVQYPDATTALYLYDAENRVVETIDPDGGSFTFCFDPNGNMIGKSYPNGEREEYLYDTLNRITHYLEVSANGNQNRLTTYSWDKEGNRTGEIRRNVGQTNQILTSPNQGNNAPTTDLLSEVMSSELAELIAKTVLPVLPEGEQEELLQLENLVLDPQQLLEAAGILTESLVEVWQGNTSQAEETFEMLSQLATGNNGNGKGNQGNGGTVNNAGNSGDPVTGTFAYQFDALYRVVEALEPNKIITYFTYDSLGNLVLEKNAKGNDKDAITYRYNKLNQLISKTEKNWTTSFSYDLKGNLIKEKGPNAINVNHTYTYDGMNRFAEGVNWKGDKSQYTYNGLGWRVQQKEIMKSGQVLTRQFVPDYTSATRRDLAVYKLGETIQRHVYANGSKLEQITEHYPGNNGNGNLTRKLYVHDGIMGTSIRYSKDNGQQFAFIDYDLFGWAISPSKLVNNDNGVDVLADFAGYLFDYVLDKYFAQHRFYDGLNRRFMAKDPIKDGLNWYLYVGDNPVTWVDPLGLMPSAMEAAIMADHIYYAKTTDTGMNATLLHGGWVLNSIKTSRIDVVSDLKMGVYSRELPDGTLEYAIVNKGSSSPVDWVQNLIQPLGLSSDIVESVMHAKAIVKNITDVNKDAEITMVGHSKGGAEAIANAVATDKNAMVFNPRIPNLYAYNLDPSKYSGKIWQYVLEGELISFLFGVNKVGVKHEEITLFSTNTNYGSWLKAIEMKHYMDAVFEALSAFMKISCPDRPYVIYPSLDMTRMPYGDLSEGGNQ